MTQKLKQHKKQRRISVESLPSRSKATQKVATVLSALDRDIKILGTDSLEDNKTVSQKLSEAAAKGVIDCVVINNKEHFDGNGELLADLEKRELK